MIKNNNRWERPQPNKESNLWLKTEYNAFHLSSERRQRCTLLTSVEYCAGGSSKRHPD